VNYPLTLCGHCGTTYAEHRQALGNACCPDGGATFDAKAVKVSVSTMRYRARSQRPHGICGCGHERADAHPDDGPCLICPEGCDRFHARGYKLRKRALSVSDALRDLKKKNEAARTIAPRKAERGTPEDFLAHVKLGAEKHGLLLEIEKNGRGAILDVSVPYGPMYTVILREVRNGVSALSERGCLVKPSDVVTVLRKKVQERGPTSLSSRRKSA